MMTRHSLLVLPCLLSLCAPIACDRAASWELDGKSVDEWVRTARDPDPAVREPALATLSEAVDRQAYTEEAKAREAVALEVLARLGPDAKSAIPALVGNLSVHCWNLGRRDWSLPAAHILIQIGPDAVPELVKGLAEIKPRRSSGDDTVAIVNQNRRDCMTYVLKGIGPAAVTALQKLLDDPDESVRQAAKGKLHVLNQP
jgi:HEAT repeat protein